MAFDVPDFQAAPGTLISMPQLQDPNFARSVVVMLEHGDEGALGLIINHETPITCRQFFGGLEMDWHGDNERHVLFFGPVDEQHVWMIHPGASRDGSLPINASISTSRSMEALEALCDEEQTPMLLGVGCAGWAPGQLESEVIAGAWIQGSVSHELVFDWPREEVWERSLRELGIDPASLVVGGGMQ